jgi:pimeloyl-ACP methyl ester carboxylesterase
MPRVSANAIELEYDTFGDPADPPLVLVMGLGTQMTAWPEPFCAALAAGGFHVIRFDNRDNGLSTLVETDVQPDLGAILAGDPATAPYLLADLAADTAGLLDALAIPSAHLVGASMGGMIVQQLAIDHPDRVRSLCSIMSTTGDHAVGQPAQETLPFLFAPPAASRDEAIDRGQKLFETIGSPAYPTDTQDLRQVIGEAYDRSYQPAGTLRQLAAILASPDRTAGLAAVTVPAAVIHGDRDRLVDVSGGYATAAALPATEPLIIEGMGHDLPAQLWPTLVDAILANAGRAEQPQ